MMKRFFYLFSVLCLICLLAACGAEETSTVTSDPPSAAPAEAPQSATHVAPSAAEPQSAAPSDAGPAQFLVAKAAYPELLQYPNDGDWEAAEAWHRERSERRERYQLDPGAIDGFLTAALPRLLAGAGDGNRVCSPLNLYMALAMAAETTDGESRAQLLALLGADSIETLESRADTLWNANYRDDGVATSILASSLWMRDGSNYNAETLERLRESYYASSFYGDMSDPRYTQALRDWLNEQTGGQLADAVDGVSLDPQTVLELVTTICFRAKWLSQFDAENTAPQAFHAPDGDIECDFLHEDWADFWVYRGKQFIAVQQSFENAGSMWFLLPDGGVTPEALLADGEAVAFLRSGSAEQCDWYYGRLALPKLDVSSDLELSDALRALGVTDVFDPSRADFSPLFEDTPGVALGGVRHAARVTMDEEGVTATAFTAMGYGAGGPEFEMDFTLDRPFLFKIDGSGNTPLFVGIVNHP